MKIIGLIFTVLLFSIKANSSEVMYQNGFIELPKHMQEKIDIGPNTVKFFFDFNCIYCKALHPYMTTWGDTLPSGMTFEFIPIVINEPLYLLNAAAWKFVSNSSISDANKYKYMHHIYEHISKIGDERSLARLIKESMIDVGVDLQVFSKQFATGHYEDFLKKQLKLQSDIHLEVTPSVLIGGKLLTHLGLVKGESKEFITLLNAVTSFYIYQEIDDD